MAHQTPGNDAKAVKSDIARAERLLARGELIRAIDTFLSALRLKISGVIPPRDMAVVESHLADFCKEFNGSLCVGEAFAALGEPRRPLLPWRAGRDRPAMNTLAALKFRMQEYRSAEADQAIAQNQARLEELIAQGTELLRENNLPKARVTLRRAAEQFSRMPGVSMRVAVIFLEYERWSEAADMLRSIILATPKDPEAYKLLLRALTAMGKDREAEEVYLSVLKRFGPHPVTCLNLARLYLSQRRMDDAYKYVRQALDLDPTLAEAQELLQSVV